LWAFQIIGGYFDKNVYAHSIAALITQEISVLKERNFRHLNGEKQPFRPNR